MMPKIYWDVLEVIAEMRMAYEAMDFPRFLDEQEKATRLILSSGEILKPLAVQRLLNFLEVEERRAGVFIGSTWSSKTS